MSLPPPSTNQAYCAVSALESGHLDFPLHLFLEGVSPGPVVRAPSLSFLLKHSTTGQTLVFDLGIRKDWENLPPATIRWALSVPWNLHIPQDVAESLRKGTLDPVDIDAVCLSHVHFDHVGDLRPFTRAKFIVGGESAKLFDPGYPIDPDSLYPRDLLPVDRTEFLPAQSGGSLGPFPHAHDLYGDGSVYIVDAPGHVHGHINLLVRTSPDGGWIYLAGDSAHHWSLITDGATCASDGWCAHIDKDVADEHNRRIAKLMEIERVRVVLAHDEPWYKENKDGPAFWPVSCMMHTDLKGGLPPRCNIRKASQRVDPLSHACEFHRTATLALHG